MPARQHGVRQISAATLGRSSRGAVGLPCLSTFARLASAQVARQAKSGPRLAPSRHNCAFPPAARPTRTNWRLSMFVVVGATGNLGRTVSSLLAATGATVTAVSRGRRPVAVPEGVRHHRGDRERPESLRPARVRVALGEPISFVEQMVGHMFGTRSLRPGQLPGTPEAPCDEPGDDGWPAAWAATTAHGALPWRTVRLSEGSSVRGLHLLEAKLTDEAVSRLADREQHAIDDRAGGEIAVSTPGPVLDEVGWEQ